MDLKEDYEQSKATWLAIQTLYCKELELKRFLETKELSVFCPMRYEMRETKDGKSDKVLVPAVHNLLFIRKSITNKALQSIFDECFLPIIIYRNRETGKFYEIPDCEMIETRAVCDPSYSGTLFVDKETAEERIGTEVRVVRGPFKGLCGKLVRYKKRSYVVILLASLGIMVHIPKWYCEKI